MVPKSLVYHETAPSEKSHTHESFEPEWITYTFSAWVQCSEKRCQERCALVGTGGLESNFYEDDGSSAWEEYFVPRFLHPMPDVFRVPDKCPEDVAKTTRRSFSAMFADPRSAANHLRCSLEQLLDHIGIKRRRKIKNGTVSDLSLHARIETYATSNATLGASLMALKWLGNSGSHGSTVSRFELLDAYEIFEHVLEQVIDQRSERVAVLAKKLTQKHGHRKRR